jgi:hypothetical protein
MAAAVEAFFHLGWDVMLLDRRHHQQHMVVKI